LLFFENSFFVLFHTSEVFNKVCRVAGGLTSLGMKKGDSFGIISFLFYLVFIIIIIFFCSFFFLFLGIFLPNLSEWVISSYAAARQGIVSVPLYATFGIPAIGFFFFFDEN